MKPIFQNIKVLDITNNSISSPLVIKNLLDVVKEKVLIFAAKNPGAMKNSRIKSYYSRYLFEKLKMIDNNDYNINFLNFESLFSPKDIDQVRSLDLNKFNGSLVELNLSYNYINDDCLVTILKNNAKLKSIKKLNLSSNELTHKIFENFEEHKLYKCFENLKMFDLSCNPIHFEKADIYKNFILSFPNLESLILKNTLVGEDINNFLKHKVIVYTMKKKGQNIGKIEDKILEMEKLFDKDRFLKYNTKVYLTISYIIKDKYLTAAKNFMPYLLERIILEK